MTKKEFRNKLAQEVFDVRVWGGKYLDVEILRKLYDFGFAKVEGLKAVDFINRQVAIALK